jgi:hypothetical protein
MNEGSIRLTRQVATRKLSMRRKKEFQSAKGLRGDCEGAASLISGSGLASSHVGSRDHNVTPG